MERDPSQQFLGFTDIKKPNVLHHPVQAKNLHFNPDLKNTFLCSFRPYGPP